MVKGWPVSNGITSTTLRHQENCQRTALDRRAKPMKTSLFGNHARPLSSVQRVWFGSRCRSMWESSLEGV
jgi:hypothetical protein